MHSLVGMYVSLRSYVTFGNDLGKQPESIDATTWTYRNRERKGTTRTSNTTSRTSHRPNVDHRALDSLLSKVLYSIFGHQERPGQIDIHNLLPHLQFTLCNSIKSIRYTGIVDQDLGAATVFENLIVSGFNGSFRGYVALEDD